MSNETCKYWRKRCVDDIKLINLENGVRLSNSLLVKKYSDEIHDEDAVEIWDRCCHFSPKNADGTWDDDAVLNPGDTYCFRRMSTGMYYSYIKRVMSFLM